MRPRKKNELARLSSTREQTFAPTPPPAPHLAKNQNPGAGRQKNARLPPGILFSRKGFQAHPIPKTSHRLYVTCCFSRATLTLAKRSSAPFGFRPGVYFRRDAEPLARNGRLHRRSLTPAEARSGIEPDRALHRLRGGPRRWRITPHPAFARRELHVEAGAYELYRLYLSVTIRTGPMCLAPHQPQINDDAHRSTRSLRGFEKPSLLAATTASSKASIESSCLKPPQPLHTCPIVGATIRCRVHDARSPSRAG